MEIQNSRINENERFIEAAAWNTLVRLITILCSVILVGFALALWLLQPTVEARFFSIVLICGFIAAYAHSVLGYVITDRELIVFRPFFKTRIPLSTPLEIKSADRITKKSIRIFGNGGFFAICGWFWNKELGRFRVFLTTSEDEKMQLLKTRSGTYVMISPESPVGMG